jgi:site-specific recombinase XerD
VKHLQVEQVQALRAAAETDRNKLFLTIIYEHGLRVSEALSLTRAHVRRGYLQIKGKKKGKRADEKVNPATLALFESVTKNLLPNTLIFPFSRQWGSELFHAAAAKAGIALQLRQGIHSLRHSLAHHLLDAGAPLPVVQKSLRHRSIGSTGVYLEADAASVDGWRSKATAAPAPIIHVHGTVAVPAPLEPMSLAAIRVEIERLSALALTMQAAEKF